MCHGGPSRSQAHAAEALASSLPDRELHTDSATAEKLVRRRRFRGDNVLLLTVSGEFFHDMVEVKVPAGPDGEFLITIRTNEYRTVILGVDPFVQLAHELGVPVEALVRVERVERLAGTFGVTSRAVSAL